MAMAETEGMRESSMKALPGTASTRNVAFAGEEAAAEPSDSFRGSPMAAVMSYVGERIRGALQFGVVPSRWRSESHHESMRAPSAASHTMFKRGSSGEKSDGTVRSSANGASSSRGSRGEEAASDSRMSRRLSVGNTMSSMVARPAVNSVNAAVNSVNAAVNAVAQRRKSFHYSEEEENEPPTTIDDQKHRFAGVVQQAILHSLLSSTESSKGSQGSIGETDLRWALSMAGAAVDIGWLSSMHASPEQFAKVRTEIEHARKHDEDGMSYLTEMLDAKDLRYPAPASP